MPTTVTLRLVTAFGQNSVLSTVARHHHSDEKDIRGQNRLYPPNLTPNFRLLIMRFSFFIALMLSVTFFIGCGGTQNPYGTVHIEGTVTLNGVPIDGANINLNPRDGVHSAGGLTDAKGKFTVNTSGFSGAKPGEYDVTFSKIEIPGQDLSFEESMAKYGGKTPDPIYHIPQKYDSPNTSGIAPIVVDSDRKKNVFTFELTTR